MTAALYKRRELLTRCHTSYSDILSRDQLVLVEQRNLHTAASDVNDRRRALDDRLKFCCNRSDRFIIYKTLFGVAEHLDL